MLSKQWTVQATAYANINPESLLVKIEHNKHLSNNIPNMQGSILFVFQIQSDATRDYTNISKE